MYAQSGKNVTSEKSAPGTGSGSGAYLLQSTDPQTRRQSGSARHVAAAFSCGVYRALLPSGQMKRTSTVARPAAGYATTRGTERFRHRFAARLEPHFYRSLSDTVHVSSLGVGTYLGECDDATDRNYVTTLAAAFASGVNLVDSAINYRCQRSERCVGMALRGAIADGIVRRDEVVICTKGGYIPLDGSPPATRREYEDFLRKQYFDRGVMTPSDVVAGGHCIAPAYITDQIRRSMRNLGVKTIDIYYLHNPEQQLDAITRETFRTRMHDAFVALEQAVADQLIACYGCATWTGFRVEPGSRPHLDLAELVAIAREAGGPDHHFRVLQLPINLAMPEAVRSPTQRIGTQTVPLLQAAAELGVAVIASASLMQGQLTRGLPPKVQEAFPELTTDAQRAAAFVRSLPAVTNALIGMKSVAHLEEQLAAVAARS
jgi:aryl-alcohol dehydrogenase-like predicted oxidoreductase